MTTETLTVSLDGIHQREFRSWDNLEQWLSAERAKWDWLVQGAQPIDQHHVAARVQGAFDQLFTLIHRSRAQGEPVSIALGDLQNKYGDGRGPLLAADSATGSEILRIREAAGDDAASFAYGFKVGWMQVSVAANPDQLRGAILASLPYMAEPSRMAEHLQRERANYRASIKSAIDRIAKAHDRQESVVTKLMDRGQKLAILALRKKSEKWDVAEQKIKVDFAEAEASIRKVEASFRTEMTLRAPVEYWEDKAKEHRGDEETAARRVWLFFPVAGIVIGVAFLVAAEILIGAKGAIPQSVYFIVSAGLATLAGLTFWAGRLLNRLYLSAHHLRIDAQERVVMTKAFLALTNEGVANENDKPIILSALFRPSSDGLVKDDAPDISVAGTIAKLGTPTR